MGIILLLPESGSAHFLKTDLFQKMRRHEAINTGVKPCGSFTRPAACVYLHAVERILADARAVTQLTAGGRGLIRGPSPFFAVRPAASVDVKRWKEACLLDDSFNPTDTTNLTAFRYFIEHYLMRHPEVNTGRWLMARQLDPTPHGLPVEVYFSFTEREFVRYEHLAADCMEHFIAMMPEFGLRAYQAPTGYDFTQIN